MKCGRIFTPGPDTQYECENEATAATEDGLAVCPGCAKDFQDEGFTIIALVEEIDGQVVLHPGPADMAAIRAVSKKSCEQTLEMNDERVDHFCGRIKTLGLEHKSVVIVLINVDDPHGGPLAEALMPGHDWQQFRDQGMVPYARGLAQREGIQEMLNVIDKEAGEKLEALDGVGVVVVDHGVAEVFDAEIC